MHVLHFEEKHYKRKQNEPCFKQNLIVTSVPISMVFPLFFILSCEKCLKITCKLVPHSLLRTNVVFEINMTPMIFNFIIT